MPESHELKGPSLLIHLLHNPDYVSIARNQGILLGNAARSRPTYAINGEGGNLSDKGPSDATTQPKKPLPKQRKCMNLTEG